MTTDLDIRIADALFDAASSTPRSDAALVEIVRRAESARTRHAGRRVALVAASAAVAAVGVAGIVVLQPGRSEAPGTDDASEVAVTPTTPPTAGTVPGPLHYDDARLLSMLYVGFDAGDAEDQSRIMGDMPDVDNDAAAQCMQDLGFQWFVDPPYSETLATDPRYVMPAADFAAQYGFGVAAEALGLLAPEYPVGAGSDYFVSLSPELQEAYRTALDECSAQAMDSSEVVTLDQAWVAASDYAWEQFEPIVHSDDHVVDALAAWRECMAAAGFVYEDPAAIPGTFSTRLYDYGPWDFPVDAGTPEYAEIEQIMAEEIAVATANAPCVEQYTATLREVILDRFDEYKSIFAAALEAGVESDGVGLS